MQDKLKPIYLQDYFDYLLTKTVLYLKIVSRFLPFIKGRLKKMNFIYSWRTVILMFVDCFPDFVKYLSKMYLKL